MADNLWYRYEVSNFYDGSFSVNLYTFNVKKHTHKGVWLQMPYPQKDKFVLNDARKRWAYPTKELAWESFQIRAARRTQHLDNQLNFALKVYNAVKDLDKPPSHPSYRVQDIGYNVDGIL